jgi:hypothetical protein
MLQNEGEEPSIIGWQRLKEQFFFIMHAQIWMIREPLSTLRHEINSAEAAAAVASIASLYPHKRGICSQPIGVQLQAPRCAQNDIAAGK